MITKNDIKTLASLLRKKGRNEEKKFLVEGKRLVEEAVNSSYECELVLATHMFAGNNPDFMELLGRPGLKVEIISNPDLARITDTENPQGIAAVFHIPQNTAHPKKRSRVIAALENVSDPGNAGTIIRNCDWFGIDEVIFSADSVDVYNPKVLRSTMGSLFHLNIWESPDLFDELERLKSEGYRIIAADMNGGNVFEFQPKGKCVLVLSNEANGPTSGLLSIATDIVTIPRFGKAESLNVASASAVLMAQIAGRMRG